MIAREFPLEISVQDACRLIADNGSRARIIDVREPFERQICAIAGSEHIPMAEIPARLSTLPKDQHLLILCHHGGRSLRVTQYLRTHGFFQTSNIAGGIEAWAQQIEPVMARY